MLPSRSLGAVLRANSSSVLVFRIRGGQKKALDESPCRCPEKAPIFLVIFGDVSATSSNGLIDHTCGDSRNSIESCINTVHFSFLSRLDIRQIAAMRSSARARCSTKSRAPAELWKGHTVPCLDHRLEGFQVERLALVSTEPFFWKNALRRSHQETFYDERIDR